MLEKEVHVYISPIPQTLGSIKNEDRLEEIDRATNYSVKRQKTYAWNLLEYALRESLNIDIDNIGIKKNNNGKLVCKECELSLSHSGQWVAVGLSHQKIGIDIERNRKIPLALIDKYAYSKEESLAGEKAPLVWWTRKEAVFKRGDRKTFDGRENALSREVKSYRLEDGLILSVACGEDEKIKIFLKENGLDKRELSLAEIDFCDFST